MADDKSENKIPVSTRVSPETISDWEKLAEILEKPKAIAFETAISATLATMEEK